MQNPTIVSIPARQEGEGLEQQRPLLVEENDVAEAPVGLPPPLFETTTDESHRGRESSNDDIIPPRVSSPPPPRDDDGEEPLLYRVATASSAWQYDDLSPRCSGCHVEFNAINRRHHCRFCGT
jgi:FYVE zinc finger